MTGNGEEAPFIFIVAGEPSGDALGGALIRALRKRTGGRVRVAGIGGESMAEQGFASLVPLSDLAVAGIAEVLPRAPLILRRVRETVQAIRQLRPDALVTIDSSGFSWGIAEDELVLTVLPGSRGGEVRRLLPVFGAALRQLDPMIDPFRVAVPTVETVADEVTAGIADWPGRPIVLRGAAAKYDAFAASRAAMAASGTVALELALARVPMVIAYRLNRLTQIVLDWVVKVRQVNLVNLILGRVLVTELLGDDCTPERLAAAVAELVRDERVRSTHIEGYDEAVRRLSAAGPSPCGNAADRILAIIAARQRREPAS